MMQPSNRNEGVIDRIVEEIYDYVRRTVADRWTRVVLFAVIEDDESGLTYGRYRKVDSPEIWRSFDTDYTFYFFFDTIRQHMRQDFDKTWDRARLTFLPSGVYDLSFEYSNTPSPDVLQM